LRDEDEFLYVKDLNMFKGEVSLKNILIIDNNVYSFAFQLENGIPILDFMGDKNDTELIKVMHTLYHLKGFDDLGMENEKIFKLKDIYNQDMNAYIRYYDSDYWT
jgi:CTD small phosphatase-like protein 2